MYHVIVGDPPGDGGGESLWGVSLQRGLCVWGGSACRGQQPRGQRVGRSASGGPSLTLHCHMAVSHDDVMDGSGCSALTLTKCTCFFSRERHHYSRGHLHNCAFVQRKSVANVSNLHESHQREGGCDISLFWEMQNQSRTRTRFRSGQPAC